MIAAVCTIRGIHRDKHGKVLRDSEYPLHSFLANYTRLQEAYARLGSVNATSTTGVGFTIDGYGNSSGMYLGSGLQDPTYGLVIGLGADFAPNINDYQLQSPATIANMFYYPTYLEVPVTTANSCSFRIRRQFTQTPGVPGGVGILECGLVTRCQGSPSNCLLIVRDVFDVGFELGWEHSLELTYKISVSTT